MPKDINQQIDDLQQLIDGPRERQMRLDGTVEERTDRQLELQAMEWRKQIEALTEDLDHLKAARAARLGARAACLLFGTSPLSKSSQAKRRGSTS